MVVRYLIYTLLWMAAFAAVLFGAAGDWRWPEAWVFLTEYAILSGAVVVWLARHDPALLRQRFAPPVHRDQALWDRAFLLALSVLFVGWLVLMALDGRRYAWSHMPAAIEALGALFLALCFLVIWLVFRANTFAVPQVRVQKDRAQKVVSDGPYAVVRHPMYAGALLLFVGMPLLLGSWWGLLAAPLMTAGIAMRLLGEERMLRRDLDGYAAYAARVKWRLVPGVW